MLGKDPNNQIDPSKFNTPALLKVKIDSEPKFNKEIELASQPYSFNSDRVGGIEAKKTPTPNTLLPLDDNGKFPDVVIPAVHIAPIGMIIPLVPYADAPDFRYWLPCDGRAIPPESALGKMTILKNLPLITPTLNDRRFLMGGTPFSLDVGGNNDGHFHSFSLSTKSDSTEDPNPGSKLAKHKHGYARLGNNKGEFHDNDGDRTLFNHKRDDTVNDSTGVPSEIGHKHSIPSIEVVGTIGNNSNGNSGDEKDSNLPQYYKVCYYVRIN